MKALDAQSKKNQNSVSKLQFVIVSNDNNNIILCENTWKENKTGLVAQKRS